MATPIDLFQINGDTSEAFPSTNKIFGSPKVIYMFKYPFSDKEKYIMFGNEIFNKLNQSLDKSLNQF